MGRKRDEKLVKEAVDKEEAETRKTFIAIIFITILVLTVISISFSAINMGNDNDDSVNTIKTSNISMNYTESLNGISIVNALPMSDNVGKILSGNGEYFDFTIKTTLANKAKATYEIVAVKDEKSTLPDANVKLYLEQQVNGSYESVMEPTVFTPLTEKTKIGAPQGSMLLKSVTKEVSESDNYRLRMWIKEDASVPQTPLNYTVRVNVYGSAQ